MKFDYCIGNPPYQDDKRGDTNAAVPVYNVFLDAAYGISNKVEMIHPARFLFDAGNTPKKWNKKMLNDEHLKILCYEADATKIFANTDIKAGVVISYHNMEQRYNPIEIFTPYSILNDILKKVICNPSFESIVNIVYSQGLYKLTDEFHDAFPDAKNKLSKGNIMAVGTNIFEVMPEAFISTYDDEHTIKIVGRSNGKRCNRYVNKNYINSPENLTKWKIMLSKAIGTGKFGETLPEPIIEGENVGHTQTFISIGAFNTKNEANNCWKYLKTKFMRCMWGVLKSTQDATPSKWKYVPLQNFTDNSDIDWSKSVPEIDQQLYRKYGLSEEEIDFIETNVKEMN